MLQAKRFIIGESQAQQTSAKASQLKSLRTTELAHRTLSLTSSVRLLSMLCGFVRKGIRNYSVTALH